MMTEQTICGITYPVRCLPALDGGHFFILLAEAITGRRLGKKAMLNIQKAGVLMILAVTILATYMDFTR